MKSKRATIRTAAAWRIAAGLCGLLAASGARAQDRPARIALLVSASTPSVPGEDTRRLASEFTARGFAVKPLDGADASREKVWNALEELARAARPQDAVVVYFSGQGAYDRDQFRLCPSDARPDSPVNDITESDLKDWLENRLKAKSVTLILDCCFSALETRGFPTGRSYAVKCRGRGATGLAASDSLGHIAADRAVVLSAACANGAAFQVQEGDGAKWAGLFTRELTDALRAATPTATYRSLMRDAQAHVQAWLRDNQARTEGRLLVQTPTLYAAPEAADRIAFALPGSRNAGEKDPVEAAVVGQVTGVAQGEARVTPGRGKSFSIQSAADLRDKTGRKVGEGVVTRSESGADILRLSPGTDPAKILPGTRVTLARLHVDDAALDAAVVRLDGSPEFQAQMARALAGYDFIKTVPAANGTRADKAAPRLVIAGEASGGDLSARLRYPDGVSRIERRDPVYTGTATELVAQLSQRLYQLATVTRLLTLQNPNAGWVDIVTDKQQYVEGDHARFTLTARQDCYVFLYVEDNSGYPALLFPTPLDTGNFLGKGQSRTLGAGNEFSITAPFGWVRVGALAIADKQTAENLKTRLLSMQLPRVGGKAIENDTLDRLQSLQIGALDGWAISSLTVTTLGASEIMSGINAKP